MKGRLLFIKEWCRKRQLVYKEALAKILQEAVKNVHTVEQREYMERRLSQEIILSSASLPDWFDKALLEGMTKVLKDSDAPRNSFSSQQSCIPFEAGRFNAHRQAETVFKAIFKGKTPQQWTRTSFSVLYGMCYGQEAVPGLRVEEISPCMFRIHMPRKDLANASPLDCSTVMGYLYGAMEKLGADGILVLHDKCSLAWEEVFPECVFELSWNE